MEQEWLSLIQTNDIKSTLARAGQVVDLGDNETTVD
jgi:hypothetical protein